MVFGTYYNENDLSVMLALGALTTLYYGALSLGKNRKVVRILLITVILVDCFYMILFTRSRGGLLGFIIVVSLFLVAVAFGRKYYLYKSLLKIAFFIAILLMFVAFVVGLISVSDENDLARIAIYKDVYNFFLSNPVVLIFGGGPGQLRATTGYAIHNYVLQVWGDFGVVGMFCYLYGIFTMLKFPKIFQATADDSVRKTCVFTCALLTVLFSFVVSDYGTIKLSWIILGLFYSERLISQLPVVNDNMKQII
jgi:O-antigen ligase